MKKLINYLVFLTFSILLISQAGINVVYSIERSEEVVEYFNLLKSKNVLEQIEGAKRISNAYLSDPEIFEYINEKLLNDYQSHTGIPKHTDLMAWLCKALASSGDSKYKSTLQKVAETTVSQKIKKYASQSFAMVEEYARQNAIINAGVDTSENPRITKLINMLKSDDITLKTNAAKIISRSNFTSSELFDVVNDELMNGYALATDSYKDKKQIDYMAWLCKALSASGMPKYVDSLKQVSENAKNLKLKKYALKSYEALLYRTGTY